jgi:phosphohistidine swiveling domain-containing protein
VLVTPLPLPHLAPLLWHSAALISIGGSSGAHLFEVARSLAVPAVIGVDPAVSASEAGTLVAVDGGSGVVSILPSSGTPSWPSHDGTRAMV